MVSRRAKDFYQFLSSVDSFTDGQARVSDWDCDRMKWVVVDVTPTDGPYRGAKVTFRVRYTECINSSSPPIYNCMYYPFPLKFVNIHLVPPPTKSRIRPWTD